MQFDLEVNGRPRRVAVSREADPVARGHRILVSIDGRQWAVDAARVDARTLSLLVDEGGGRKSYEVAIVPDRTGGGFTVQIGSVSAAVGVNGRRGTSRKDDDGPSQAGPQQVRAAMPGRVVRVLIRRGDAVTGGQGLVVIEAMKMENELRAARDGRVADVRVREGMSVEAGALLVVIE
jgi:biotin carboxyl carrier protein